MSGESADSPRLVILSKRSASKDLLTFDMLCGYYMGRSFDSLPVT